MKKIIPILFVSLSLLFADSAYADVGWVGNRSPDSGTTVAGEDFNITNEVWQGGVTEGGGQGAGITCEIYYGMVDMFGGTWMNISSVSSSYTGDTGNNDIYSGNLNLAAGLYEYKCRCSDNGGSTWVYDDESNGQLTVDAVAPVSLVDFEAISLDQEVHLNWTTESEENNSHFEVEKSQDLISWESVTMVSGKGNSFEQVDYQAKDEKPWIGLNYYRLKQVDFDGSLAYSSIINTEFSKSGIHVYPNPARDFLRINLENETIGASADLYNLQGQLLKSVNIAQQQSIDISELQTGTYLLRISNANAAESHSQLIQVQR